MENKLYSSPELTVHGAVEDLTQVIGFLTNDLINGVDNGADSGTIDLICDDINNPTTCVPVGP